MGEDVLDRLGTGQLLFDQSSQDFVVRGVMKLKLSLSEQCLKTR